MSEHAPGLPHEAIPVSKLESGAHLPVSGLAGAERRPGAEAGGKIVSRTGGDARMKSSSVRFGSKADIGTRIRDVRFTPESGHYAARRTPDLSERAYFLTVPSPATVKSRCGERFFERGVAFSVTREELLKHNTTGCQFGLRLQWACKHC